MSPAKRKLFKTVNDGLLQTNLNNYFQITAKTNKYVNEMKKNGAKNICSTLVVYKNKRSPNKIADKNMKSVKCKANKNCSKDESHDNLLTKIGKKSTLNIEDEDVCFASTSASSSKKKIRVRKIGADLPETSPKKKGKFTTNNLDGTEEVNQGKCI